MDCLIAITPVSLSWRREYDQGSSSCSSVKIYLHCLFSESERSEQNFALKAMWLQYFMHEGLQQWCPVWLRTWRPCWQKACRVDLTHRKWLHEHVKPQQKWYSHPQGMLPRRSVESLLSCNISDSYPKSSYIQRGAYLMPYGFANFELSPMNDLGDSSSLRWLERYKFTSLVWERFKGALSVIVGLDKLYLSSSTNFQECICIYCICLPTL